MFIDTGKAAPDNTTITFNSGNAYQALGVCPIGSVIAWLKNLTGTPSLPSNWCELDGSTISDAASPYDGVTIPNLQASNYWLRGDSTSGATGGSNTHNHGGATGTNSGGANSYGVGALPYDGHTHSVSAASSEPAYYKVVWIMRFK